MFWQDVCENASLKDLPFKIELNAQGQLLMTPVKVSHSLIQGKIIGLLYRHSRQEGEALAECAIKTQKGTKVADVAWASTKILKIIQTEIECSIAPVVVLKLCLQVIHWLKWSKKQPCILSPAHKKFGCVVIMAILNIILCKANLASQK